MIRLRRTASELSGAVGGTESAESDDQMFTKKSTKSRTPRLDRMSGIDLLHETAERLTHLENVVLRRAGKLPSGKLLNETILDTRICREALESIEKMLTNASKRVAS